MLRLSSFVQKIRSFSVLCLLACMQAPVQSFNFACPVPLPVRAALTSKPAKISGLFALAMLADCIKNNRSDLKKLNPLHLRTMLSTIGDHISGSVCAENIESRKKTAEFTENFFVHKARFTKEYLLSNPFLTACTIYFAQKGIRSGVASWKNYQTLKASDAQQLQQDLTQAQQDLATAQQARRLAEQALQNAQQEVANLQATAQAHLGCPAALQEAQQQLAAAEQDLEAAQQEVLRLSSIETAHNQCAARLHDARQEIDRLTAADQAAQDQLAALAATHGACPATLEAAQQELAQLAAQLEADRKALADAGKPVAAPGLADAAGARAGRGGALVAEAGAKNVDGGPAGNAGAGTGLAPADPK